MWKACNSQRERFFDDPVFYVALLHGDVGNARLGIVPLACRIPVQSTVINQEKPSAPFSDRSDWIAFGEVELPLACPGLASSQPAPGFHTGRRADARQRTASSARSKENRPLRHHCSRQCPRRIVLARRACIYLRFRSLNIARAPPAGPWKTNSTRPPGGRITLLLRSVLSRSVSPPCELALRRSIPPPTAVARR